MSLEKYYVGIDLGSTTAKIAVLDENGTLVRSDYQRHGSKVKRNHFGNVAKLP